MNMPTKVAALPVPEPQSEHAVNLFEAKQENTYGRRGENLGGRRGRNLARNVQQRLVGLLDVQDGDVVLQA